MAAGRNPRVHPEDGENGEDGLNSPRTPCIHKGGGADRDTRTTQLRKDYEDDVPVYTPREWEGEDAPGGQRPPARLR